MIQKLLFSTEVNNFFIVSDTHFNHDRPFIYKNRGFSSMQEHDDTLIERWNEIVNYNDVVLHLGDFILYDPEAERLKIILRKLKGKIYYVWGNHNSGTKALYQEVLSETKRENQWDDSNNMEIYPLTWNNKLTFLGNYIDGHINKTLFSACHYPVRSWNQMQSAAVFMCGHCHGNDKELNKDYSVHKRLDFSIDNFGRPVSFEDAMKMYDLKKFQGIDHHV